MLRSFYRLALLAHPRTFRERFAEEMLDIFDQTSGRRDGLWLAGDAIWSLWRQWALRPEFRRGASAPPSTSNGPVFALIGHHRPPTTAFAQGTFTAALLFVSLAMVGVGGSDRRAFIVGARGSTSSWAGLTARGTAALDTEVRVKPADDTPSRIRAVRYFRAIRVLFVLDADRDLRLSPWEIATGPAALRALDRDHDGRLSGADCGWAGSKEADDRRFMSSHPVLAALDVNHDGAISGEEIARSGSALRALDRNGDGP